MVDTLIKVTLETLVEDENVILFTKSLRKCGYRGKAGEVKYALQRYAEENNYKNRKKPLTFEEVNQVVFYLCKGLKLPIRYEIYDWFREEYRILNFPTPVIAETESDENKVETPSNT